MMPQNWLDKNEGKMPMELEEDEQNVAVHLFMAIEHNRREMVDALVERLIDNQVLCEGVIKSDAEFGKMIKQELYLSFESSIQDDIDRHTAPEPRTVVDQAMFDAGFTGREF